MFNGNMNNYRHQRKLMTQLYQIFTNYGCDEIVQGNYAIHYQSILRDNSEKSFEY